jgi:hypothetical protein
MIAILQKITESRYLILATAVIATFAGTSSLTFAAEASQVKTFDACLATKGVAPMTKTQRSAYLDCRASNKGNKTGFVVCLRAHVIVPPSATERAARLECRREMSR